MLFRRPPLVNAIEEEYRYIQFHPFECGCGTCSDMMVERHGVIPYPSVLVLKLHFSKVPRVYDSVEVRCNRCGGIYTYYFDVSRLHHIKMAKVGLLGWIRLSQELITIHMQKVIEVQKRLEGADLAPLRMERSNDA